MEKRIFLFTKDSDKKNDTIKELNDLIRDGWIIDTINCDHCNEYEVEADIIIYLKRP
jgi:hypothetical protein